MSPKSALHLLVVVIGMSLGLAHDATFPKESLFKIFPDAENFAVRKRALTGAEVADLERQIGAKSEPEDRDVTFYVAIGKDKAGKSHSLGAVFLVDGAGPKGMLHTAIGFNVDRSLRGVLIMENKNDPGIEKPEFLSQLAHKTSRDPLVVGKDVHFAGDRASAEALIRTVRKGMILLGFILKS